MIRRVTIQGFRSITEIRDLELGRLNVFIGANGSGKSNVLEAIGVLGAAAQGRINDTELRRRGVRPGVPALFKSAFGGRRRRRTISLSASSDDASYSVSLDNPIRSPVPDWRYCNEKLTLRGQRGRGRSPSSRLQFDDKTGWAGRERLSGNLDPQEAVLLDSLDAYGIHTPTTALLRSISNDEWARSVLGLSGGGLPKAVSDLLRMKGRSSAVLQDLLATIEWVDDIRAGRDWDDILSPAVPALREMLIFRDRWMRRGYNRLTAYDASEGALFVLFLAVAALHPGMPPILAIDNFDSGMHPRLCRAATRFVATQLREAQPARQLLLTTHNPLALDGLDLRDPETRLFAVERDEQGGTVCRRVELRPEILDSDNPDRALSQLWVLGYLGGVPDVW